MIRLAQHLFYELCGIGWEALHHCQIHKQIMKQLTRVTGITVTGQYERMTMENNNFCLKFH